MKTILNIDDDLLNEAVQMSGNSGKTAVVRAALKALIARESAIRLADLGSNESKVRRIHRRRPPER